MFHFFKKFLVNFFSFNRKKDYSYKFLNSKLIFYALSLVVVICFLLGKSVQAQFDEDLTTQRTNSAKEFDELFGVKVRVLEIPGDETINVFGKKINMTDGVGVNHSVVAFTSIPYAVPPNLKNLRFQRPTMNILTEDFQAVNLPAPCPQLSADGTFIGDENCLHLNIYMPLVSTRKSQKLPVLVIFHGESMDRTRNSQFGLFTSGSAEEIFPQVFLFNKIVVVTPQYRLGSLGFLSTVNEDLNGNVGLFDQLQALEWIQRFISYFGGDPKQITLMGYGSSAISSGLLATSELTRGLVHRLILMSGSPLSPVALDPTPKLTFAEIALQNSCPSFPTLQFVRCMQDRKLQNIILADHRLIKGKHLGRMRSPVPIIQKDADGRFLPPIIYKQPSLTLSEGNFEPIPLIIGVSSSEMSGFLPSLSGKLNEAEIYKTIFSSNTVLKHFLRSILGRNFADAELISDMVTFEYFSGLNITERQEQANDLLEEVLSDYLYHIPALSMAKSWSRFSPVYFYLFDYVTISSQEDDNKGRDNGGGGESGSENSSPSLLANHGSDIRFLMHGYKGSGLDREISSNMIDFWINFIYKGSPLNSGTDWPQFREDTKEFLRIGEEIESLSGFRVRQEQFWTELVPSINSRICGTVGGGGSRNSGRGGSSLVFGESGRKQQKIPLIFKDVNETDFSKRFFLFASSNGDYGDEDIIKQ